MQKSRQNSPREQEEQPEQPQEQTKQTQEQPEQSEEQPKTKVGTPVQEKTLKSRNLQEEPESQEEQKQEARPGYRVVNIMYEILTPELILDALKKQWHLYLQPLSGRCKSADAYQAASKIYCSR